MTLKTKLLLRFGWYRIWSDKWIEQGGRVNSGVQTVQNGSKFSFLKTFANTNYVTAFLSAHGDTSVNNVALQYGNFYYGCIYNSSKTASSFKVTGQGTFYLAGY